MIVKYANYREYQIKCAIQEDKMLTNENNTKLNYRQSDLKENRN